MFETAQRSRRKARLANNALGNFFVLLAVANASGVTTLFTLTAPTYQQSYQPVTELMGSLPMLGWLSTLYPLGLGVALWEGARIWVCTVVTTILVLVLASLLYIGTITA